MQNISDFLDLNHVITKEQMKVVEKSGCNANSLNVVVLALIITWWP